MYLKLPEGEFEWSVEGDLASLLLHQGENIKYVQRQLGHASVQTTLDLYRHLLPDIHNRAEERLDKTAFGNRPK